MPKRGINIHKRKDGRWEGRCKIGTYENGATKYRSVYGKTYGEVKAKMQEVNDTSQETYIYARKEKNYSEVLRLWLNSCKISIKESTAYKYEYLIEHHIEPELGSLKISHIAASLINSFLERKLKNGRLDQKGGLSKSYVKTIMLVIRASLQFAAEEGYCNPLKCKINKPSETKNELAILDKNAQKRLEQYLSGNINGTSLGIILSLHTGLRIGEVCALSWDDVDFSSRIIHVRHTVARVKGNKSETGASTMLIIDTPKTKASKRDIPISSFLFPLLMRAKKEALSEFIVSDRKGFLSPRTYEYRYHQVLKGCGIEDINYHALRHTFATRCVEAGVDIKSLSEILGHANVAVTLNTYVHSSMELKRTQLEKFTEYSA